MADSKITALTSISTSTDPANDPLVIVDVSDTSMAATGTTKKVTLNQLLGASGTATLASATITGDLTVDTSTLKVDSANDVVGVGTNSPNGWGAKFVSLRSTTGISYTGVWNDGTNNPRLEVSHTSTGTVLNATSSSGGAYSRLRLQVAGADQYQIDTSGVFTWYDGAGGTRMTLNSNGLGVGESPISGQKLTVNGNGSVRNGNRLYLWDSGNSTAHGIYNSGDNLTFSKNNGTTSMLLDATGNLGIGVQPSAWATSASRKAIQISTAGSISAQDTGTAPYTFVASNWVSTATGDQYILGSAAPATLYRQFNGTHAWYYAGAGTGSLTFTPAMTLDASGNLLVGKSVSLFSTVGVEASGTGFISATNSASTNATTNLSVYSTGAAAFRFYVGLGGTVYATNTTISAISDARLKENVQDIDVGLGAILALKPRKFDWKEGKGKDIKGDRGFIAQEFEQVFPQLVDEWKDAAPEGEAPYKSVRQDLIPVLVKAIQELTARVQTLETR